MNSDQDERALHGQHEPSLWAAWTTLHKYLLYVPWLCYVAEEMCVSVYTCADRSISYHSNHRTTERLMSQFHDQVLLADAFI